MINDVHTKVLVDQATAKAKEIAVEKGTSWLTGHDTTAFSNLGPNAVQFGSNVAAAGAITYETIESIKNGEVIAMVEAMASQAVSEVGARIGKLIGEYTGRATSLVTSIPERIGKETVRRVTKPYVNQGEEHIMTLAEFIKIVIGPTESLERDKEEKHESKAKSEKLKKAKKIITEAVRIANKFMADANKRINYIKKYALEGPEWVANELSDIIDDAELEVRKLLDEDFNYLEELVDNWAKEEGKKLGGQIVQKTNKELHKLANKIRNDNEEAITQAKIKAKSVLQKGKLFIMSKLGINISVPISLD